MPDETRTQVRRRIPGRLDDTEPDVMTDLLRESPVDIYQRRFRRTLLLGLLLVLLVCLVAVAVTAIRGTEGHRSCSTDSPR